ncbi:site-specific DNA recombinase [Fontibacillus phaseoli]|uniref:Site-specific DNA recombinase n=1 Tax=Fontibacillus phaseoli TaxID=1416533 RepID=A0A369B4V6_9BACL|nr:recombinase family protein [Fontibacillus phaseoli]RCX15638.1 site-specific DNA recombinase [Fontibacillus phaseoli]
MEKSRVAIYCRVSTEEQANGFSLESQAAILEEYAKSKNYEVYDLYIDDGYSGKDFKRPEIQRLLRDANEGKFDIVLAWKVDRISRSNRDVLNMIEMELHPRNIKLLISTCDIDSTTTIGYMFISLLGTFAEYERTVIIERVEMGMSKRASNGNWCGGKILGYDSVNGVLEINEQEKDVVTKIFEMRASGLGYKAIASRMNELSYTTKHNKAFQINTIKTILNNPTYIGKIRWGQHRQWDKKRRKGKSKTPIIVEGKHEAIISKELWDKAEEIAKHQNSKALTDSNLKGQFLLSGILRCPQCGAGTVMTKRKKRSGEGYHLYYMCQAYHSKGITACRTNLIDKQSIEVQLIRVVKGILCNQDLVRVILDKVKNEGSHDIDELNSQLNAHLKEMNKLIQRKEKFNQAYILGDIENVAYNEAMKALVQKIDVTEQTIHKLNVLIEKKSSKVNITEELILEALQNFDTLFEQADIKDKKQLIKALVKKIEVEPDRKWLKSIVFWFSEGDALPLNDMRRTVS